MPRADTPRARAGVAGLSHSHTEGAVSPSDGDPLDASRPVPSGIVSFSTVSPSMAYTAYLPLIRGGWSGRVDPNDPHYPTQWALQTVSAPQAWPHARGDGVIVAVVDSGVQLTHPDLAAVMWVNPSETPGNGYDDDGNGYEDDVYGWDFVDWDALPADEEGHGTHVAGIVGAATDNGIGIAGMGWGVTLMAVRVLDEEGEGSIWDVSEGIRYAADNGAHVINLSLGATSIPAGTVDEAIAYAQGRGVLVVAAAGNQGRDWPFYPAAYDGVLGVGATDSADRKASFSNYGSYVDVAAPGVSLYSTVPNDAYTWMSGTSMAAPMVSGLAALVWASAPSASWSQVAEAIQAGADDLGDPGPDPYFGWGRINAPNALNALCGLFLQGQAALVTGAAPVPRAPWVPGDARDLSFRPGEVIVSLRGAAMDQEVGGEAHVLRASRRPGLYLLRVPIGQEMAYAEGLRARADVAYAYPNYTVAAAAQ